MEGAYPVPGAGVGLLTRSQEVARFVHASEEQLEPDDGVNDDDKEHEKCNMQQRHQRLHDGIEHYVQACGERGVGNVGAGSAQRPSRSPLHYLQARGTSHSLGTPDTSLSGLSTRNARNAFTSKAPGFPPVCGASPGRPGPCSSSTLNSLMGEHRTRRRGSGVGTPPLPPSLLLGKVQVPLTGNANRFKIC